VLLEEFTQVLSQQVEAIQQAIQDAVPNEPTEGEKNAGFDVRAASAAIARLRALLESSDGDAAEAFLVLEGVLAGICDKPRLSALDAAISECDFGGALSKLDEITNEYGANWGQVK
jgi:hypothetical protein